MTGKFIYFFLSETWNVSFHHIIHTVANDVNQVVFTVFQNSVPFFLVYSDLVPLISLDFLNST